MPSKCGDDDGDDNRSRLHTELELLQAMYPECTSFRPQTHEFIYTPLNTGPASLRISIPETYPSYSLPIVISALDSLKKDVKTQLADATRLLEGSQEALDVIIAAFDEILSTTRTTSSPIDAKSATANCIKTVIIWLHHLLNTNKRKQILAPPQTLMGVSKPGYPGILLFSGPSDAVDEHVHELKQLNWQAFQVRYEAEEQWHFSCLKEVETIADIVQTIGERGHREIFMEAMRMK